MGFAGQDKQLSLAFPSLPLLPPLSQNLQPSFLPYPYFKIEISMTSFLSEGI